MQHSRVTLEEKQHRDGTTEQELATERCPDTYASLKLTTAVMGTKQGRYDRHSDDRGQFGEVALGEYGGEEHGRG